MRFKIILIFLFVIFFANVVALQYYGGNGFILTLFTITSNVLLYFGFRKNAIFFDMFIGVFLWLGFWLKTIIRITFLDSRFSEGLSSFIISPSAFDKVLLISSIAFITLIITSLIREKYIYIYNNQSNNREDGLFAFYKYHRKSILIFYITLFVFVALSNAYFGIYQRGEITQTVLPFGLNGIYKWLLLFGISSFAALILNYEFKLYQKTTLFVPILTLIEACITNVSLLSRGMILNTSALGFGIIKDVQVHNPKTSKSFWIIISIVFVGLFISSVIVVNSIRANINNTNNNYTATTVNRSINDIKIVFLDRWVGIEGMIAVSTSDKKGWKLFQKAINEKYDEKKTSFYDLNLINSPYINTDMTIHHYISLPGFIAFFYYANSIVFLMIVLIILSIFACLLELMAYKLSNNNLILASLIAQVVAYRYAHFGYVPAQSYLLFGAIILNIFIIYGLNKVLFLYYEGKKKG